MKTENQKQKSFLEREFIYIFLLILAILISFQSQAQLKCESVLKGQTKFVMFRDMGQNK